jgi:hypothetical protein
MRMMMRGCLRNLSGRRRLGRGRVVRGSNGREDAAVVRDTGRKLPG